VSRVVLKLGREKSILRRHPWIFSGAIANAPSHENGEILPLYSFSGELLAHAYFHSENSIAGRILSFGSEKPMDALYRLLDEAIAMRQPLEGVRLINAEGDGIPGLIVDRYKDILVMQVSTCGIERLKKEITAYLIQKLQPRAVYEKSNSAARKQEGLAESTGFVYGEPIEQIDIEENGVRLIVPIVNGQKTGLFLDQREMRRYVGQVAAGKKVLNCFAYTGGFSWAALAGNALSVDSVEISEEMCVWMKKHSSDPRHKIHCVDAFDFLKQNPLDYDLIILDPPAFAKKKSDVDAACRAYKEINRLVFEKAPKGTLLVTSSCSSYIPENLFRDILAQAAGEARRDVRVVSRHAQAPDHPVSIFHPEGDYLKSFILRLS